MEWMNFKDWRIFFPSLEVIFVVVNDYYFFIKLERKHWIISLWCGHDHTTNDDVYNNNCDHFVSPYQLVLLSQRPIHTGQQLVHSIIRRGCHLNCNLILPLEHRPMNGHTSVVAGGGITPPAPVDILTTNGANDDHHNDAASITTGELGDSELMTHSFLRYHHQHCHQAHQC
jgi:hypothetical protein